MEGFIFDLSIVLVAAAFLSFFAVFFKQPVVIAYILCGILVGPWGLGWVRSVEFIEMISHLGITLLLFLAGLYLHPQKLLGLFRKTSLVVLVSCASSFTIAYLFSFLFGFSSPDSLFIGFALMFSSTILVLKLLPTTTLHQKRMGAVCISVLILEDLLAIGVLVFVRCFNLYQGAIFNLAALFIKLTVFVGAMFLFEHFILWRTMKYVDRIHEALFILGLAWCFGIATIAHQMGLFFETGAFFAGVMLARHKISFFISESLKPLRDFFLVLFFFSLGAQLDFTILKSVFLSASILAVAFIILKPWIFKIAFLRSGEKKSFSKEVGIRLGQLSEFSLLIALLAFEVGCITHRASQLIQMVTIITFVVSSYIVVFRYPTPIGTSEKLLRD